MIFDIIIVLILVIALVSGFRRGFVYSFVHTLGLIGSLAAGFIFAGPVRKLLEEHTMMDENFYSKIFENVSATIDTMLSPADTLPLILSEQISAAADGTAEAIAESSTDFLMSVISFALIFIIVKLVCFIVISLFSKKNRDGFTGFVDGLLGLAAGLIKGILFVFILLALLAPAMNLVSPASAEMIMNSLDNSYLAGTLYDANFLLLILGI